jgi:hypothetical protein
MALTVTIADRNAQRVRLVIDNPDAYTLTKITRSDASGVHSVRVVAGALPTAATGMVVLDYEASMLWHAPVRYDVYENNTVRGSAVIDEASPWWDVPGRGRLYLNVPLYPSSGIVLNTGADPAQSWVTDWTSAREGVSTAHRVVGRSDPVVVLRPAATRTGTFTIVCPSLAAAQQVTDVLAQPQVFQLRQSDQATLDMYFTVDATNLTHGDTVWRATPQPERRWSVAVTFTEVGWPTGAVVPVTVWTYADVVAGYGDYNAVAASFATYADLLERIEVAP